MPLSTRDSTHYRMCAPHAIFDVAVGRVQMKLLLPRGVDLAWETLEASCQSELSSYLRPSPLPLSIFHPNVIITFNECYLLFEINKTHHTICSRAISLLSSLLCHWCYEMNERKIFPGKCTLCWDTLHVPADFSFNGIPLVISSNVIKSLGFWNRR